MDFFDFLTMLGGLAVFLYGMNIMSDGLIKVSGSRLEGIIASLTKNRVKAVVLGAGVTAVIQSSSATTVMVVGFVNAGIMKLSQAIGVIMGANVGTTVTAWILSLTGIESDAIVVQLFKPASFSPIIAAIAVVMYLQNKNIKRRSIAEALMGFALLMFGMQMMSGSMKPLASDPNFASTMLLFENPILSVLAGTLITAIIQSSSASVGILQALSITGALSINAAIPIILGQNIGTCITAMLSTIGTNRSAKRTAFAHLYFNIIGTLAFATVYFLAKSIFDLSIVNTQANPFNIAIIHSLFNVSTTLVLLPFVKQLEKLAYLSIPETSEEKKPGKFDILDARFITSASFAIKKVYELIKEMAELDKDSLKRNKNLINQYSQENADVISDNEAFVDEYEDHLRTYITKISKMELLEKDSQDISSYMQMLNDLERISDHSLNIMQNYKKLYNMKQGFTAKAKSELMVIAEATEEIMNITIEVIATNNGELALNVEPLENVISKLHRKAIKRHIKRMKKNNCTALVGLLFSDIIAAYERIAAYCSNIAICFIYDNDEPVEEHKYTEEVRKNNEEFQKLEEFYKEKYYI